MKHFLFLALLMAQGMLHGQTDSCNIQWAPWQPVPVVGTDGGIFYSVQTSKCIKGAICGSPLIAMQHTFAYKATVELVLKGTDCADKEIQGTFSSRGIEIPKGKGYKSSVNAHTFKRVTEVLKAVVTYKKGLDTYRYVYDKAGGIKKMYVNGRER